MSAPCALLRDVSPETLRRAGFTSPSAAHDAARCAQLWAADHHPRPATLTEERQT